MSIIFILTACTSKENQAEIDINKEAFIKKFNIKNLGCKHNLNICYDANCDYCHYIDENNRLIFFACTNVGCYYE